ncbi:MAG: response regulator [Bacteroidota bacterium]|nr:response regulator [Bacteroidota bacterium]
MKKILVIDDDEDILESVSLILEKAGFDVDTHNTGLDVLAKVLEYKPHAILLDVKLPGKSGTEVYKELCKTGTTPVIFFSANADKQKVLKECDAYAFIAKPFDMKNLVQVISGCVNRA